MEPAERVTLSSFLFGQAGVPVVHAISNYERADQRGEQPKGTEQVTHSSSTLSKELPIQITTSGSYPFRRDLKAICAALKAAASLDRLKALCVKAVKDIAYGKNKARGSVGASCQWAFVGPNQDHVWIALDVVGGAAAQELPNLINITAQVPLGLNFLDATGWAGSFTRDAFVGGTEAKDIGRYDATLKRPVFSETICGICGSPIPAAHRSCEVCSYEEHRGRAQKRFDPMSLE